MHKLIKIPHCFYERETVTVAKELLGTYLVHHEGELERIGKIVEVEAYLGQEDLASHSSKGLTKKVLTPEPISLAIKSFSKVPETTRIFSI